MQLESTPGVVPVHHQIADQLRAKIVTGQLKPGEPVPSVNDLCRQWHCSPGSARSALAVLAGEGRITGGRGKRATVRAPQRRIRLTLDMTQEQKNLVLRSRSERASKGTIEMTAEISIDQTNPSHRYEQIPATAELAEEFGIPAGDTLLRRTYEMTDRESGVRLSQSVSYIPLRLIEANPDLLDETKEPWPGGHMHQLYTVGIEIDQMVRSVTAISPTPADRQRWGMEPGVPLLYVHSRTVDITGRTVEASDAAYPADRTDLLFTEKLKRWPKNYPEFRAEVES